MRILLRKINGQFGAMISSSGGRFFLGSTPSASHPGITFGMNLMLLVLVALLSAIASVLLFAPAALFAMLATPAAPALAATDLQVDSLAFLLAGTIGPFTTNAMLGVLENLKRPVTGLLNAFFPTITQSQTEHISFDIDEGKRYLAPFVSPLAEAPVKDMKGQRVDTFSPAYVKEKARWTPDRALRRSMGEAFGGTATPEQRRDLAIANELQDQMDRIQRRKEAMAFEALFSGQVTVVGDKYPEMVVNFGRDSALSAASNNLTGTDRWNQTNAIPNDDLDDMSELFDKLAGAVLMDVVLDSAGWKAFRGNKQVLRDLELPKYDAGTIMNMEANASGLQYKGQYGGYRIWKYVGFYTASNGTETATMEGGYALCVGQIDGVQHHGAIQDEESGMQPLEIFPKSWITPDPSVRWIMSQSAPLVVPRRINACGVIKVLNAS